MSIASDVKFVLGGNHNIKTISTYPFKVKVLGEKSEAWTKGPIVIEDDVWIATGCIILSGVRVGKGAIIAAGSIVTKDVPCYAIVGGNPARIIKYRFPEEIIDVIKEIEFSELEDSLIEENIDIFYQDATARVVQDFKELSRSNP